MRGIRAVAYRFFTAEDLLRATGITTSAELDESLEREQTVQYVLRATARLSCPSCRRLQSRR